MLRLSSDYGWSPDGSICWLCGVRENARVRCLLSLLVETLGHGSEHVANSLSLNATKIVKNNDQGQLFCGVTSSLEPIRKPHLGFARLRRMWPALRCIAVSLDTAASRALPTSCSLALGPQSRFSDRLLIRCPNKDLLARPA